MQKASAHQAPALSISTGKTAQIGVVRFVVFIAFGLLAVGLDRPPRPLTDQAPLTVFSAERAFKHLAIIARAPHPINSPEHDAVRDYIVRTLQELGLDPQVQKTTNINKAYGIDGALENIVVLLKGSGGGKAVLLVSHYDSVAAGPGASDNGVAVAAFLEAARSLKALPQMKRDIIFLFTDGEERGMLGARAFVTEHPWARDVAFVFNFEARGTGGPSIMFETSDNNGWLISNFASGASYPVANSLSYEIYKRLPNNTDFTIFRQAGYSGLNFAFIDGLRYYHTRFDSVDNVSHGSLQHQGDYVLEMTRQFANSTSDDPRTANLVYFDLVDRVLVHYTQKTAAFLLALTWGLTIVSFYIGFRNKILSFGATGVGLVSMILGIVLALAGAGATSWIAGALGAYLPRIRTGLVYHPGWYILAFSAVGLSCATAFYSVLSKRISNDNLMAGAFLGWLALTLVVSIYLPGGSYLLVWPLLFVVLGQIAVWTGGQAPSKTRIVLATMSALPAILLIAPMAHKLFFAFAQQSTLFVSALISLLLTLLIGQIAPHSSARRWAVPLLSGAAGLGLFIIAVAL
jgi:hypothetical protein